MIFNAVQKMRVNKTVDAILALPANQARGQGGLELAFVLDENSHPDFVRESASEIVKTLKAHDRKFQNVRCNAVFWGEDGSLCTQIMPMAFLQLGRIWENRTAEKIAEDGKNSKNQKKAEWDTLMEYLKFYHARSKCIFILTDQMHEEGNHTRLINSMNPFLKSKILIITPENFYRGKCAEGYLSSAGDQSSD